MKTEILRFLKNLDWMVRWNVREIIRKQRGILTIWDVRQMCWMQMDLQIIILTIHPAWKIISWVKMVLFRKQCMVCWEIQHLIRLMEMADGTPVVCQMENGERSHMQMDILVQKVRNWQKQSWHQKKESVRMCICQPERIHCLLM